MKNRAIPATRLEIYKDENCKWRWRLISKAQVRTESPQGYVSKQGCLNALNSVKALIQDADQIEL